jgi:cell wall-associated NlpC family hydrolase
MLLVLSFPALSQQMEPAMPSGNRGPDRSGISRDSLIIFARQYLGTPYRRAGTDPKKGFDCSGFVRYVFSHFDVALPRSSREYKALGRALKPEEFKTGDVLVFYGYKDKAHIGHVGIICEADGMKSRFIHASSGRAKSVTISNLDSEGYKRRFYKCIDVIK